MQVYRALRVVNPSPYMIYLQGRGTAVQVDIGLLTPC